MEESSFYLLHLMNYWLFDLIIHLNDQAKCLL